MGAEASKGNETIPFTNIEEVRRKRPWADAQSTGDVRTVGAEKRSREDVKKK